MTTLIRILLVEDASDDWQIALSTFSDIGLMNQTCVVKDDDEVLDFLHVRGAFKRRAPGLPAVILLGANLAWCKGLRVLHHVRNDPILRRVPVVMMSAALEPHMLQSAYDLGVNSVVLHQDDAKTNAEAFEAMGLFWGFANEPPPGCLRSPKSRPHPG